MRDMTVARDGMTGMRTDQEVIEARKRELGARIGRGRGIEMMRSEEVHRRMTGIGDDIDHDPDLHAKNATAKETTIVVVNVHPRHPPLHPGRPVHQNQARKQSRKRREKGGVESVKRRRNAGRRTVLLTLHYVLTGETSEEGAQAREEGEKAVTSQWGTYGIIDASDQPNKEPEFRAWLVEERHINPETLVKDKERKEFLRFVEDFNTATLPHEKYYDMEKYEIKMRLIRGGEAIPDMAGSSTYDPNADLAAHSNSLKRAPVETDSFLNKAQVEELRRVQSERSEVAQRKVLGMSVSKNMGVRHEEKNKLYR
ncbi:hypothetical protein QFC24_001244 [Naganishia onofrii]|uniref:Uncharacterized protein n=1 Tax=Naganishia onofrii TaxID=1851511 RepID=A0ACC2XSL6_9TREE|nr:hypothetical protein QFC24_001244 [Naganishia onofrii]